jgi:hypothetical protein
MLDKPKFYWQTAAAAAASLFLVSQKHGTNNVSVM